MADSQIVAGIDVGGPRKGFHAVALRDRSYFEKFESKGETAVTEVAAWCRRIGARIIGVDAPCHWSQDGHARPCERALMREGIWCFSTPTQETAETHPTGHYAWMLNGAKLFNELGKSHELFTDGRVAPEKLLCFETFPHAIACKLAGKILSARQKNIDRRDRLHQADIDLPPRSVIDTVDAALCALTALYFADNTIDLSYGEPKTGFIVVPEISAQLPSKLKQPKPDIGKEVRTTRRRVTWQFAVKYFRHNGYDEAAQLVEEYHSTQNTKSGWDSRLKSRLPECWALVEAASE